MSKPHHGLLDFSPRMIGESSAAIASSRMATRALAIATTLAFGLADPASTQVSTPAKPVTTVEPDYPEAALLYGIDGLAGFVATVDADGSVSRVRVLTVPRQNLGFEDALEQAVRQWRFEPATVEGKPVMSSYPGSVRFVMP